MQTSKTNLSIKAWSHDDQPRSKLLEKGAGALSNSELLAILIGSGSTHETAVDLCKRILFEHSNDLDKLARVPVKGLMRFRGIGEAKAISIAAALELGRRRQLSEGNQEQKITSSYQAYQAIGPILGDKEHEEFWILLLDRSSKLIKRCCISQGGVALMAVDPKLIFREALQELASGLVLIHNHPSNHLKPSKEDIALTRKIKDAAALLDIRLLDHLIVGSNDYFSFVDDGIL